jgi:hypothetical protein
MSDDIDNSFSYGLDLDEELDDTDEYSKMMRTWINDLPDNMKSEYTYSIMRSLKRENGIDAKRFMWLSEKQKLEVLGIYVDNQDFGYEE